MYPSERSNTPVFGAGKPLALLAYVGLSSNQHVERRRVAELLWRTSDPSAAMHALRQCLYRLRSNSGNGALVRTVGPWLELDAEVRFQCAEGERSIAAGELGRGFDLLRGRFLAGLSIPESPEFQRWLDTRHVRYHKSWYRAGVTLADRALENADPETALALAEELVGARPFDDDPARILVTALAKLGRAEEAVARFGAYAHLLEAEVEAEPTPELVNFVRTLERKAAARPAADDPPADRCPESGVLEAAWTRTREGCGSIVLVEGKTGAGKTRLLGELAALVRSSGGVVLGDHCYEVERAVPFAALADALAQLEGCPELDDVGSPWLQDTIRMVPALLDRFPSLTVTPLAHGLHDRYFLHRTIGHCLQTIARHRPILLALDDMQWADRPSVEAFHSIARHLDADRVLCLATYDPTALRTYARELVRSVVRNGRARRLVLEPPDAGSADS